MATTPQVETISTGADKAKLAFAALLAVGALAAFYLLGRQDLWVRLGALLGLTGLGVGVGAAVWGGRREPQMRA